MIQQDHRTAKAIQPFGTLIVADKDAVIRGAAENCAAFLGPDAPALLGKSLTVVFNADTIHDLRNIEAQSTSAAWRSRVGAIDCVNGSAQIWLHRIETCTVIELLKCTGPRICEPADLRALTHSLSLSTSRAEFFEHAVREVQIATGYRTALGVYAPKGIEPVLQAKRGPADGSGALLEAIQLGLARDRVTYLADLSAQDVRFIAENSIATNILDQTVLRVLDPKLQQIAKSHSVESLVVLPIARTGEIWGYIALLHPSPKPLHPDSFANLEHLSQVLSLTAGSVRNAIQPPKRRASDKKAVTQTSDKILIVEDDLLQASHIESILAEHGVASAMAQSHKDALDLLKRETFSGVLLDWNLAGALSQNFAQYLQTRAIPFVLITGYALKGALQGSVANARILEKPVEDEALIKVVQTWLNPVQS